jgi:hypothetical protein
LLQVEAEVEVNGAAALVLVVYLLDTLALLLVLRIL